MNEVTEWLANLPVQYAIAACLVLLVVRTVLLKSKSKNAVHAAETVDSFLIAVALVYLVIKPFIIQAFFIPSGSMEPGLTLGDRILVNKFVYRFRGPEHGDIIVFRCPKRADPKGQVRDYIKRLIGKPGDIILIENGEVYRNGERLEEPYILEPPFSDFGPKKIEPGMLFVMGDNRNDSNDSRYWGELDKNRVVGKAVVKFWPPGRIGKLH